MAYLLKGRRRVPIPNSKLSLLTSPVKDRNSLVIPTVTGGCAADPTCDVYNIFEGGPAANVVRGAASNLLDEDSRSFENDDPGIWTGLVNCTTDVIPTDAWHGSKCLEVTSTGGVTYPRGTITSLVVAGDAYTFSAWVKAKNADAVGELMRISLYGNVSSFTHSANISLSALWLPLSVTKTFDAGDTTMYAYLGHSGTALDAEDIYLADGCQLTNTAYPLWFCNGDGTAMTCSVPTANLPLYAGGPFTLIFYVIPAANGDDGVARYLFHNDGTGGSLIRVSKSTTSRVYFDVYDNAAGAKQSYSALLSAANWAAGTPHAVMCSRSATGVQNGYVDRTMFAALNVGAGTGLETALGANCYWGSTSAGISQFSGPMHKSFLNRAITEAEWLAYCDLMEVA